MSSDSIHILTKFLETENIQFECKVSLSEYTTFRLGGACPCLVHCETASQLGGVIAEVKKNGLDFILIGSGSNLLVSDCGVTAVVVRYVSSSPSIRRKNDYVTVSGGTELDKLVQYSVGSGIEGFVNCSGIPGTVGGAIIGNAGAFGWQIADCLKSLVVIDRNGFQKKVLSKDIIFSYRHSSLRESQEIVLEACFKVSQCNLNKLRTRREEILRLRSAKHPDIAVESCAGSFFKNIEPTSAAERRQAAGWFLDQAGAKAMQVGSAGVFHKHANIIIRKGSGCTAQNVFDLSCMMAETVRKRFGIHLVREVQLLGKFDKEYVAK